MTDRINYLTVVLEQNMRSDDCESLINAIRMIRGVLSVTPNVADPDHHMAEERARQELGRRLMAIVYPER
jgi:hypothetical protein